SGAAAAGAGAAAAGAGVAGLSVSHIAAAVAVAVVSAGGAVEVQQTLVPHHRHHAAIHRTVAAPALPTPSGSPAVGAVSVVPAATGAAELRLPLIPASPGDTIVDPGPAPTLDPSAPGAGNGGVAAPVEPPADALDPIAPPVGDEAGTASEGDPAAPVTTPPPATGSSAPPADAPPPDDAPPATSAAPAPAPSAPPTSASVGGASYPQR
ncbi:MAG: hypothetical protein JSS99_18040, partial [Actinobacteria bacterium]|nr:hypothetical protein [Actinomycetota bacterium]